MDLDNGIQPKCGLGNGNSPPPCLQDPATPCLCMLGGGGGYAIIVSPLYSENQNIVEILRAVHTNHRIQIFTIWPFKFRPK